MAVDLLNDDSTNVGTLHADEVDTEIVGVSKIMIGAATVDDGYVSSANPLPVTGTVAVTGTFWQATQPVSLASVPSHAVTNAGTFAVQAAQSGTWDIGTITNAVAVTGTFWQATQPVSGTVSISGTVTVGAHAVTNAGTFAVQVDGTALTRLTDIETNTDSGAVVGNGAAATAQRVTIANDSTGTVVVSGTVTANAGTGTFAVSAASLPLPSGASTAANQSTGNIALAAIQAAVETIDNAIAGSEMQVDIVSGSVSVSGTVTVDSELPSAAALADNTSNPTVPGVGAFLMSWDGATWDRAKGDSTDGLLVNLGANNDVTVTGTVTANAGTGTLAVSLASVPSHAVTNAGTFAVQVDGSALTALQLIDDPVATLGTTTYTEATTKGMIVGAVRRDADTTLVDTTNEVGPLQMDANGRLKVEAFSGETLPVSLASVPSHAVTNAGTFAVQVDGSALTALQLIDDPVIADDAAFTPGTTKVMMAGFQADESSTDSVDEGDGGAARMTLDRKVIVTPQPHTAGGLSVFKSTDIDETEEDVKTSAGQVYGIYCVNTHATAARYLKVYNATAANVTVGSTATVMDLLVPPTYGGFLVNMPNGIAFGTAISVAATTGVGDADTGAPGASEVQVHVFYK